MASFRMYTTLTGDELVKMSFAINVDARGIVTQGHAGKLIDGTWVELIFDRDKGMYYFAFETLLPASVACSPLTQKVLDMLKPYESPILTFTAYFNFRSLSGRVQGDYAFGTAQMRCLHGEGTVIYSRSIYDTITLADEFYKAGAPTRLVTKYSDEKDTTDKTSISVPRGLYDRVIKFIGRHISVVEGGHFEAQEGFEITQRLQALDPTRGTV